MDFRNFMIALQALFVVIGNLQTLPEQGLTESDDTNVSHSVILEIFSSPAISFPNNKAIVLPPEQPAHTDAILRGKRFEWLGEFASGVANKYGKIDENTIRLI